MAATAQPFLSFCPPPSIGRVALSSSLHVDRLIPRSTDAMSWGAQCDSSRMAGLSAPMRGQSHMHIGENADVDVPAGTISRLDGYLVLSHNTQLVMMPPHMHGRGKRQCLEAIVPATTGEVSRGNGSPTS